MTMHEEEGALPLAVRVSERYWRIGDRLIPAVSGGSGTAPAATAEGGAAEGEGDAAAELDAKLNAAIKSHLRRERKEIITELSKVLGEKVAELTKAAPPPPPDDRGSDKKVDPQVKLLQEKIEKLERQSQEERTARIAAEDKARKDGARSLLREAFDQKGIKGARAAALISHLEATGQLHFAEDGEALLTVTRSRQKGAPPEALDFDLAAGVVDWCNTQEAAEFLPAPQAGGAPPRSPARPASSSQQPGPARRPVRYDEPAVTDEEAARRTLEQLTQQGADVAALLGD